MKKFIINTDGGARGNPGPAASAFIIYDEKGAVLVSDGIYLGKATNNEAEYLAVKYALDKMRTDFSGDLPVMVEIRTDSKLVVEQLSGRFKVKNSRLREIYQSVKSKELEIGQVKHTYIPRSENYQVDKMVNKTLDNHFDF